MITYYMILVMIIICVFPSYIYHFSDTLDKRTVIHSEIRKYKEAKLLEAIIKVESNYNPIAISNKGALGLMQIMPNIWGKELREAGIIENDLDYFDIKKNIRAGNFILAKYNKIYKNPKLVLTKYSGGAKNYCQKVFHILNQMKGRR